MISPNGIASIIDYPKKIDEDTHFLYFHYKSYTESYSDRSEDPLVKLSSKTAATHIITEISWV